ncbi:nuclear transport factor 2 family protein [Streptomyces sp. NPDC059002]|uniref:nuclear transport factor 2 family protein n=1 Tax=Streptomyces sp. NPDC059002 TaxID=3346690 RepID=UPI0036872368
MTETTAAPGPRSAGYVSADLYAHLQQFYARQMGLMDDGRPDEWAATFTDDGVFDEPNRLDPLRGRDAILASARERADRLAAEKLDFRHWLAMLDVQTQDDGTLRTRTYALAMRTPRGGSLDVFAHVVCHDHLVPVDGSWAVRHRRIDADGVARDDD